MQFVISKSVTNLSFFKLTLVKFLKFSNHFLIWFLIHYLMPLMNYNSLFIHFSIFGAMKTPHGYDFWMNGKKNINKVNITIIMV